MYTIFEEFLELKTNCYFYHFIIFLSKNRINLYCVFEAFLVYTQYTLRQIKMLCYKYEKILEEKDQSEKKR